MDGQELGGRNIRVSYATEKRQPQPYNSNYGGNPDYWSGWVSALRAVEMAFASIASCY
jgi:hypothetical protein